jgi:glycosyltransferase involved in cell wall biosynthesis
MLDIDVIPCCADLDHFDFNKVDFQQQSALKTQLGIQEKDQILTYLGSIGGWYMTKEMFGFFKQLKAQHPDFKMLILTKDDPSHVQAEAHSFGISSEDIIVTYADRKSLPVYLSLSTCSIFFIRNTFSKKASSPTKHAELMGMGIPVICNVIGDLGMIIEDTRTGLIIHEFTDLAYQQAIKEMGALLSMRKQDIRDASFHYFDLQDGVSKYLSVYKRLFNT